MQQHKVTRGNRHWAALLTRLILAAVLTGGWAMFAVGLPAHAVSISAEDPDQDEPVPASDSRDDESSDPAPASKPREDANSDASQDEDDNSDASQDEDDNSDASQDEPGAVPDVDDGDGEESVEASPAELSLSIDAEIGEIASGARVSVEASGLLPGSRATLFILSSSRLIGQGTADADGFLSMSATLPGDLAAGEHTVLLLAKDATGNPTQQAISVSISADGTIDSITDNSSTEGLEIPEISDNPMVPAYPVVVPLDAPAAVVATAIAGLTVATVASVGFGGSHRGSFQGAPAGPSGGGLDTAVRGRADVLDEIGEPNLPQRFRALAGRRDLVLGTGAAVVKVSPLLSRTLTDAAPLRAFTGSFSLLLPLAALLLGIFGAVSVDGRAEPAVLAFMIPLMVIGIFDALAGIIGAVAFAVVVALSGGIVDTSSVRTLLGVGLIMVGPGLIAGSFRDIRRGRTSGRAATWEHLTDLVVVPLIGAWTTIAIIQALPSLGALEFPIAQDARLLGLVALIALFFKVLLEEAAARKVPGRMRALSPTNLPDPSATQQAISAFVRTGAFLFIAAAFVGNVWQLWVAAIFFLLPGLLALLAHRFKNSPTLWQVIPDGVPLFVLMLVFGLIVSMILRNVLGEVPDYAQVQFLWMAVPGFLLALLGLVAREPKAGDTRWYTRPTMTMVYRVGGVIMLIAACILALRV